MSEFLPMTPLLPSIDPRPMMALLLVACYVWRGRFAAWMVVDWLLISLLIYRPSIHSLISIGALMLVRHVPAFAETLATELHFDAYTGLTAATLWLLFPGARALMQSEDDGEDEKTIPAPVSIPVSDMAYRPPPQGADIADMEAQIIDMRRVARDITDDQILMLLCELRKPNGTYRHSMNEVYRRVGGDRNTVMAKIKAIRENAPAAQFRQEDGNTAPAHYPVTKDGQL